MRNKLNEPKMRCENCALAAMHSIEAIDCAVHRNILKQNQISLFFFVNSFRDFNR